MVPIENLIPYANNSRTHSDKQVSQIAASIKEFGFTNPVLTDGDNGIIAGHGRVLAAQKLKLHEVPTISLEYLSDVQRRAYVIADNKLALNAGWDEEMLSLELEGLHELEFGLDVLGFEPSELAELGFGGNVNPERESDSQQPLPEQSRFSIGDCFRVGNHVVSCSDSRKKLEYPKNSVVIYDPPYDEPWAYSILPTPEECEFCLLFWDNLRTLTAVGAAYAAGWRHGWEIVWDCVSSWYVPSRPLMRHKTCLILHHPGEKWNFEKAVYDDGKERVAKTVSNPRGSYHYTPLENGVHLQSVFQFPITQMSKEHSHQKPLSWMVAMLNGCSARNVIDLFCGSGTGAIASHVAGACSVSQDLCPLSCEITLKRLEKECGIDAARFEQ